MWTIFLAFCAVVVAIQVVFIDYPRFRSRRQLSEREQALSHASWGVVMLLAAVAAIYWLGGDYIFAGLKRPWNDERLWWSAPVPVLLVWGTSWALTGSGYRSRGIRDGRIVFRCLLRLGVAAAVWLWMPWPWWAPITAFCTITAAVKLGLVMRHPKGWKEENRPIEAEAIYGKAGFTDAEQAIRDMRRR